MKFPESVLLIGWAARIESKICLCSTSSMLPRVPSYFPFLSPSIVCLSRSLRHRAEEVTAGVAVAFVKSPGLVQLRAREREEFRVRFVKTREGKRDVTE